MREEQIPGTIEGLHSRKWYMGRNRKLGKYKGVGRRVWKRIWKRRKENKKTGKESYKEKNEYWKGIFPRRFTARKLYGLDNKKYDREYWNRMEKNWKEIKPLKKRKLEMIEEEKKYQGGKIEEWNKEDEIGKMGDPYEELWQPWRQGTLRRG